MCRNSPSDANVAEYVTDLGLFIRIDSSEATIRAASKAAEATGYCGFWVNNPPGQDGISPLAWVSQETARIKLGVGVVPVSAHTPSTIVERGVAVRLPKERLRLGIGSGSGPRPVERVQAALEELRPRISAELVVAALGPRMCELAGRAADSVLLNAVTPEYAKRSAEIVRRAAAEARRPTPRVYALLPVALGEETFALAERTSSFYARLPAYAGHFKRMGAAPIETTLCARDAEELRAGFRRWCYEVDELVVGPLLPKFTPEDVVKITTALADAFA
jgi:alkanesulfonate monooxygenase SsuD/methylene tetrahydromethanopterin reductase-like flavin-dependent oxidoreductase (luciferase family)